jgi:hypothetical protein
MIDPRAVFKGLSILRLVWVVGMFMLFLTLHAVKTIYPEEGGLLWSYLLLTIIAFILYVYSVQKPKRKYWIYTLVFVSLFVGFIPYESEIYRVYNLLLNPNENLSDLSKGLPLIIGVAVDVLFYPFLTFAVLLASSVRIKAN